MPAHKTSIAQQAEAHGITYACAKYRLAMGIPLDAPIQPNGNEKAQDKRRKQWLIRERERERIRQRNLEQRMARRQAREDAKRIKAMEAARRLQERVEAKQQERDAWMRIKAAPRREWRNPFASMVVR